MSGKHPFIFVLFMILSVTSYSQLTDCSDCNVVMYRLEDVLKNSSDELEMLRNEIFARKGYIFKDKGKTKHFKQYEWYVPAIRDEKAIKLNEVETSNVGIFHKQEKKLKNNNDIAISELKSISKALKQQNVDKTLSCLNGKISITSAGFESKVTLLKNLLRKFNLNDIHWYRDEALQVITKDNGDVIEEFTLKIDRDGVRVSRKVLGVSKLVSGEGEEVKLTPKQKRNQSEWYFTRVGRQLKLKSFEG